MRRQHRISIVAAVVAAAATAVAASTPNDAEAAKPDKPNVKGKIHDDTLTITGGKASETITLRLRAGDTSTLEVSVANRKGPDLHFDRGKFDTIVVNAGDGDDTVTIDESNGAFTDTDTTTLNGEGGNDTLLGGSFDETLDGGDGNDTVDGNRGSDTALLGAGDDTFAWNPGDGSDTVEGQDGTDTLRFNGANVNERFDISANGARLRLTRDIGNVTMDTDGVETVDLRALGGADTITVNDLTGTAVTAVDVDLAADGKPDRVAVDATAGDDVVSVSGSAGTGKVSGLAAAVAISGAEAAADTLVVNALDGADVVDASRLAADAFSLEINGGNAADMLIGSAGDDTVDGGRGDDTGLLGGGDDTFVWDPGDGNDIVEGQAGTDTMRFDGANVAERIELAANGGRLRFTRDIANITMDTNAVERVDLRTLGGADRVVVGDLSGTDVGEVLIDLAATGGAGDGQPDTVTVDGTAGADVIDAAGSAGAPTVGGLAARVAISGAEPALDRLTIDALGGDDAVTASGLAADAIGLVLRGGDGDDVLIGGAGDDDLHGDAGDDVLIGGPGLDTLDGGPGNNILLQD